MKRFVYMALAAFLLLASPQQDVFDDFNYSSPDDSLFSHHGWIAIDGINAPPSGAIYDQSLISFESDPKRPGEKWMTLRAVVGSSSEELRLSRVESTDHFYEGTYATRVFFDHALRKTRDGNIQTFYLITTLNYPNDTLYSECDIEYLPYDIWHPKNNKRSALYTSTWETYQPEPYSPDHAMSSEKRNLYGWHTLIIEVMDGKVKYYIDRSKQAFAVHEFSDKGSTVYPDSPLQIAFANWISVISDQSYGRRSRTMMVEWFYHAPDTSMGLYEILRRVNELKKNKP